MSVAVRAVVRADVHDVRSPHCGWVCLCDCYTALLLFTSSPKMYDVLQPMITRSEKKSGTIPLCRSAINGINDGEMMITRTSFVPLRLERNLWDSDPSLPISARHGARHGCKFRARTLSVESANGRGRKRWSKSRYFQKLRALGIHGSCAAGVVHATTVSLW
jgi:hypothetical protein